MDALSQYTHQLADKLQQEGLKRLGVQDLSDLTITQESAIARDLFVNYKIILANLGFKGRLIFSPTIQGLYNNILSLLQNDGIRTAFIVNAKESIQNYLNYQFEPTSKKPLELPKHCVENIGEYEPSLEELLPIHNPNNTFAVAFKNVQ